MIDLASTSVVARRNVDIAAIRHLAERAMQQALERIAKLVRITLRERSILLELLQHQQPARLDLVLHSVEQ